MKRLAPKLVPNGLRLGASAVQDVPAGATPARQTH
jgi:hypothetical protein